MTQHTPGPWVISRDNRIFSATATEYSRMLGKEVPEWVCATGESAANARLIAAAPDLLAALERCLSFMERIATEDCIADTIGENQTRAAIRKAKGE